MIQQEIKNKDKTMIKKRPSSWLYDYIPGLVSIIIPVYNVEKYVQKAIDSALSQDYKKIEVLLIDDGSTDSSGNICDFVAEQDSRVRVIHQSNEGLGGARNTGIAVAKGEYFSFLDGDDWIDKTMISKMVDMLKKYDGDIVMCNHYYVIADKVNPLKYVCQEEVLSQYEGIKAILENKKVTGAAWDKIYKRKIFQNIWYPARRHFEDSSTTYKTLLNAHRIVLYPDTLYYYYQREGSITQSASVSQEKLFQNDYDLLCGCIEKQKIISSIYPDLSDQLARETDFNALRVYNETILLTDIDAKIRRGFQKKIKHFIKKRYTEIMLNPLSSRPHKIRIKILIYFPVLYEAIDRLLYKKRGNYS